MRAVLLLGAAGAALGHGGDLPLNPDLGVPGYPDCEQTLPRHLLGSDAAANEKTLRCAQRPKDHADQIAIGCIGDSITAGAHSSSSAHTYPSQLQSMLEQSHPGMYKVTNLGACGSTMQKCADSPYWQRPQYKALTAGKWDIITIMLGTNDAKDKGSGHGQGNCGPDGNWAHNCTGAGAATCPFATDYAAMIKLVRTLGTTSAGPKVYVAVPPPLMQQGAYGMNQTVINTVFPMLVPAIGKQNNVPTKPIDTFTALGGEASWAKDYPKSCTKTSDLKSCPLFCDDQSCDQCHPNDDGYTQMAKTFKAALGL